MQKKRSDTGIYDQIKKYENDNEKKIYDKLVQKEQEIEMLKQQLQDYKQYDKRDSADSNAVNRPVRKREYHIPQSKRVSKSPEIRNPDENFHPKINAKSRKMLRQNDVWSMLYQDARDREVRQRSRVHSEISNNRKRANSKQMSNERTNNRFLVKKIMKNLNEACKTNNITINRVISYHEMVKILYNMGYICDNITEYEKLLVDNIFQSISNPDKTSLFLKNLFAFWLAVHGISTKEKFIFYTTENNDDELLQENNHIAVDDPGINIQYDAETTEQKMQPYGFLGDKSNFHFYSMDEIKEISKLYKVFLDNCKISAPWAYYGASSPEYELLKAQTYSFKPKINESRSSKQLNISRESGTKNSSHAEKLLKKGQQYKKNIDNLRLERKTKETEGCTFIPKTNALKNKNVKSKVYQIGKFSQLKF